MKKAIIIFSRIPEPGKTKTRLMPYFSGEECAFIHQNFITKMMHTVNEVAADVLVFYTPKVNKKKLTSVFGINVKDFYLQEGMNLGERMEAAFDQAFHLGYESVLLIGTDIPQVKSQTFEDAFDQLDQENVDVIINPTEDGGYYLIGMKKPNRSIWNISHYGTNTVFENTLKCIEDCGFSYRTGERLMDIDTADEYKRYRGSNIEDCIQCNSCTKNCLFLSKYDLTLKNLAENPQLAYSCFLCGACKTACPKGIDGSTIAIEIRKKFVKDNDHTLPDKSYAGLMWEKNPYKFANYKKGNKKSVLFPGCNFPSFFPDTMKTLEDIMKKHNIGVIYDCCGKPVYEAGLEKDIKNHIKEIQDRLRMQDVEELIVLCPNCYYFLRDRINLPIVTIYDKLYELNEGSIIEKSLLPTYIPCPDRTEQIFLNDIRKFLNGKTENPYKDVQCCGLGGLASIKEPELAKNMINQAKNKNQPLYTYCASCISNFKRNGMQDSYHILPIILGIEEKMPGGIRPFLNRAKKKL